jgi:hypothetical protein
MGGAIAIWRLKLLAHLAVGGQRQAFLGYRRASDIAAQPLQLASLVRLCCDTGMQ